MKKCPNCGAQIADDSLFCTKCGESVLQVNICPHCGMPVNVGDTFCTNCGNLIELTEKRTNLNTPLQNNNGSLCIRWDGRWFLFDSKASVSINGVKQGDYSIKKGFNIVVPITSQKMVLETKHSPFHRIYNELYLNPKESYTYELVYNPISGGFGSVLFDNDGNELESYKVHWFYTLICFFLPVLAIPVLFVKSRHLKSFKNAIVAAIFSIILGAIMSALLYDYDTSERNSTYVSENISNNDIEKLNNSTSTVENISNNDNKDRTTESDKELIKEWYLQVFGLSSSDSEIDKYLAPNLKEELWTEDYDGVYEVWQFRTNASDSNPEGDVSRIESITSIGDGWYEVKYLDMGWKGSTKVKVIDKLIVDFVKDRSWQSDNHDSDNINIEDYSTNDSSDPWSKYIFVNEYYIINHLLNQRFVHNSGLEMWFDGEGRFYIDGDYAGVISVLRYDSKSALLRYGNGLYGEGKLLMQYVDGRILLSDTVDGSVFYQKKIRIR